MAGSVRKTLRDNLDFVLSAVVVLSLAILSLFVDEIEIAMLSPSLAAAIFTVVISSIGALFSVLIVHSDVIKRANQKGYLVKMKRTFQWPVRVAIVGFTFAILASIYRIQDQSIARLRLIFTLNEWFSILMGLLLVYSIFSFRGAFYFVTESTIRAALDGSDEDDIDDPSQ